MANQEFTEVLHPLCGVIQWSIDLMNFLMGEMMELSNLLHSQTNNKALLNQTSQ